MRNLVVLAAMICMGFSAGVTPALAQHGPGSAGGGMGRGGGMGAGPSNMPSGHDMGQPNVSGNPNANGGSGASGPKSASEMLTNNHRLDTALTSSLTRKGVLPAGTNLADDCKGFNNLGRCIAALHVSHNRNLDFFCMRQAMTSVPLPSGDTSTCSATGKMTLGKAIQTLAPDADAKGDAKQGTHQADADIKDASS